MLDATVPVTIRSNRRQLALWIAAVGEVGGPESWVSLRATRVIGSGQPVTLKVAKAWSSASQSASVRIWMAMMAVYEASAGLATSTT